MIGSYFVNLARQHISEMGTKSGMKETSYDLYKHLWMFSEPLFPDGEFIWEREFDLLIILDACRLDMFEAILNEYEFLPNSTDSIRSVAGNSELWMKRTFSEKKFDGLDKTAYISGNPNTMDSVDHSKVGMVDEVYEYGWNEEYGTVLPETITDQAITTQRQSDYEKLILHYMQPHHPFINSPEINPSSAAGHKKNPSRERTTHPWKRLRRGKLEHDLVWKAYMDNLRYILDHLPKLLNNIDAERAIITSDHGNLVGEYGLYAHPSHCPISTLRDVPWCVVDASDTGEYSPENINKEPEERQVHKKLEALGYRT